MYKFILLFCILACQPSPSSIPSNDLFDAFHLSYAGHDFDIIKLKKPKTKLRFFLADQKGAKFRSFKKLKNSLAAEGQTLHFAMNGGMYLKDGSPQGLYIEQQQEIKSIDTIQEAYGNFYLQPNGIFYIENQQGKVQSTTQYLATQPKPEFATQSGPMLVIDSLIHPVFVKGSKNLNIRNGVGIDSAGHIVFAISNNELNLYDFASLFKDKLACKNALYLDGFVSKAYIPTLDRKELGGNFGVIIALTGI